MNVTTFFDVDNTLLDNDRAKVAMDGALARVLGTEGAAHFWRTYEAIRAETGSVNIPQAMARLDQEMQTAVDTGQLRDSDRRRRRDEMAEVVMGMSYEEFVYRGSAKAIAHAQTFGAVAIFSEGDATFQPSKIWRAGLTRAVDGHVLVYDRKRERLREATAAYPSDHWIFVDDKALILHDIGAVLGASATTVWVRQGSYANVEIDHLRVDHVIQSIGDFAELGLRELTGRV